MTALEITLEILCVALGLALAYAIARLYKLRIALYRAESRQNGETELIEKFRTVAAQTLEGNSQQFLQLAKSTLEKEGLVAKADLEKRKLEIDHVVAPLQKKLEEYDVHLKHMERE